MNDIQMGADSESKSSWQLWASGWRRAVWSGRPAEAESVGRRVRKQTEQKAWAAKSDAAFFTGTLIAVKKLKVQKTTFI